MKGSIGVAAAVAGTLAAAESNSWPEPDSASIDPANPQIPAGASSVIPPQDDQPLNIESSYNFGTSKPTLSENPSKVTSPESWPEPDSASIDPANPQIPAVTSSVIPPQDDQPLNIESSYDFGTSKPTLSGNPSKVTSPESWPEPDSASIDPASPQILAGTSSHLSSEGDEPLELPMSTRKIVAGPAQPAGYVVIEVPETSSKLKSLSEDTRKKPLTTSTPEKCEGGNLETLGSFSEPLPESSTNPTGKKAESGQFQPPKVSHLPSQGGLRDDQVNERVIDEGQGVVEGAVQFSYSKEVNHPGEPSKELAREELSVLQEEMVALKERWVQQMSALNEQLREMSASNEQSNKVLQHVTDVIKLCLKELGALNRASHSAGQQNLAANAKSDSASDSDTNTSPSNLTSETSSSSLSGVLQSTLAPAQRLIMELVEWIINQDKPAVRKLCVGLTLWAALKYLPVIFFNIGESDSTIMERGCKIIAEKVDWVAGFGVSYGYAFGWPGLGTVFGGSAALYLAFLIGRNRERKRAVNESDAVTETGIEGPAAVRTADVSSATAQTSNKGPALEVESPAAVSTADISSATAQTSNKGPALGAESPAAVSTADVSSATAQTSNNGPALEAESPTAVSTADVSSATAQTSNNGPALEAESPAAVSTADVSSATAQTSNNGPALEAESPTAVSTADVSSTTAQTSNKGPALGAESPTANQTSGWSGLAIVCGFSTVLYLAFELGHKLGFEKAAK